MAPLRKIRVRGEVCHATLDFASLPCARQGAPGEQNLPLPWLLCRETGRLVPQGLCTYSTLCLDHFLLDVHMAGSQLPQTSAPL